MASDFRMSGNDAGQTVPDTNIYVRQIIMQGGGLNNLGTASEARVQMLARASYTIKNLYVYISALFGVAGTIRSRINGIDAGNLTISITATGALEDTVNTGSLVSGDLFNLIVDRNSAMHGDSVTVVTAGVVLSHATSDLAILGCARAGTQVSPGATTDSMVDGAHIGVAGSESNVQWTFRTSSTLSNLRGYVNSNTSSSGTFVLRTRINAADGGQSASWGAGITGAQEDTTNTDAIASGDKVNYRRDNSAGNGAVVLDSTQVLSASPGRQSGSEGISSTIYNCEGNPDATEASAQVKIRASNTARNLIVNVNQNTRNGASTSTFRQNNTNTSLTLSVAASTTGIIEDLANSVTLSDADTVDIAFTSGGSTGTINLFQGYEQAQPVPPLPP